MLCEKYIKIIFRLNTGDLKMKKILIISLLLIVILSFSSVSAQENSTDTADIAQTPDINDKILIEDANKEILTENVSEEVPDDASSHSVYAGYEYIAGFEEIQSYISISDSDIQKYDRVELYIDNNYYTDYYIVDFMGTPFDPQNYDIGEHVVTAKYCWGNNSFSVNTTFRVVELQISIPDEIEINNLESVAVTASSWVTGNITVYVNGSEYKKAELTEIDSGMFHYREAIIYLNDFECGIYEIKVVYSGDETHPETSQTKIINATYRMYFTQSVVDNINYYYNASVVLPKDINNTPVVIFEGKTYTMDKIYPTYSIFRISLNLSEVPTGKYYINITYPGDNKYPQQTITEEIIVKKLLKIENITVEYGMPIIVNLTSKDAPEIYYHGVYDGLYERSSGSIIKIEPRIDLGDGEFVYNNIGNYSFNILLTELDKVITCPVTIIPASTNITSNVEDITYTEIATINITGTAYGKAIVKIDENNTKTISITKNTNTPVTFENIPAGKHNITVTLKPTSSNYNESTYTTEFTVFKKQPSIDIVSEEKIIEGNTLIVNVTVPNATGKIRVNEKETYLINGKASIELSDLILGDNTITVIYNGDDNNLNATSTKHVTVLDKDKPKNVTVIVDGKKHIAELVNDTIVINTEPKKASQFADIVIIDDQTISFVLKDEDGKSIANAPIKYTVNGKANTVNTNKNGEFVIAGENCALITINYAGNENITGLNTNIKLNNPITPTVKVETHFNIANRAITIKGYAVDTKAGEKGIYYSTTLLDEKGNPIPCAYIEFAVNNKIYNRTTYENGSFNPYKLNMVRAGRYTMAFNFAGDDNYTNTFACVCVDLNKKPITIKAPAKSFKVATKTKKYTATLSTIKGLDGKMYLSPQTVKLTVKGKTFTGQTNDKGQVTFKITNLNKKGTYKATISYKGDKTYEEAEKTVKLTIK